MLRKSTTALTALLVLLLMCTDAFAQGRGKISGTVTDAETGETLPGVNVVLVGTTIGATTDSQGDYFIANVESGTHSIRASFVGFRDVTVSDVRVSPNSTTEIDIEMRSEAIEFDEVLVTAQRPLVEKDNTTSLVVLESAEIAARPTRDLTNILTTLPSINVESGQMVFRGGTIDQVSFLLDGARVRNPVNHEPYTRINLSSIDEMEVITGAFNAEYGEARSGIVNVITKEGGDRYEAFLEGRYSPSQVPHFGPSLYDRSTDLFWENRNARHLEWWIEHPDMWVDPNGNPGNSPLSVWTPEEAHENYLETHQPLTDYDTRPTYQAEVGLGGPVPLLQNLHFFVTGKYREAPPVMGNSFRERGEWIDATYKLTYRMSGGKKLTFSGFQGNEDAGWGFWPDFFWADAFGNNSRYAFFDIPGFQDRSTEGQTLRYTHVLNSASMYEVKLSRLNAFRRQWTFPADPIGWEASDATRDNLRAVDETGNPIPGGFSNRIGFHTSGYIARFENDNTEWSLEGFYSNQFTKVWQMKTGLELVQYNLDHFNEAKFPGNSADINVYKPRQGAAYVQNKIEFGGLITNAGLRLDFYDPNEEVFLDLFNPLEGERERADVFAQLSPRLGVSHPIDEKTVLHFSYGHFFQRPPFFDDGEGLGSVFGNLTTMIVRDTLADTPDVPVQIGNRNLRPTKTINYEVGLERNFWDFFVLDITGFFKDSRNTLRTIEISTPRGTYRTNGNGNYGDDRGIELSIRKVPSVFSWGAFWGYANYTTSTAIRGRSGDPVAFSEDQVRFAPSGDAVFPQNDIFKAGIFYATPSTWSGPLGTLFKDLSVSVDYFARFANEDIRSDIFVVEGEIFTRPTDQNWNLRARKDIRLAGARVSPYVEVQNLFNDQWLALSTFERASRADQKEFAESGFKELPDRAANGAPILPLAMFRNLPRTTTFGITLDFD